MAEKTVNVEYVKSGKTYNTSFSLIVNPAEEHIVGNVDALLAKIIKTNDTAPEFNSRYSMSNDGQYMYRYIDEDVQLTGFTLKKGINRFVVSELDTVWSSEIDTPAYWKNTKKAAFVRDIDSGYFASMTDDMCVLDSGQLGVTYYDDVGYDIITVVNMTDNSVIFSSSIRRSLSNGLSKHVLGELKGLPVTGEFYRLGQHLVKASPSIDGYSFQYVDIDLAGHSISLKEWAAGDASAIIGIQTIGFISPTKQVAYTAGNSGSYTLMIIDYSGAGYAVDYSQTISIPYCEPVLISHGSLYLENVVDKALYVVKDISVTPFQIEQIDFSKYGIGSPSKIYGASTSGHILLIGCYYGSSRYDLYLYDQAQETVSHSLKRKLYEDRATAGELRDLGYGSGTTIISNLLIVNGDIYR